MIKNKDETLAMFKKFRTLVKKSTDEKVKMLTTNRRGEFFLISLTLIVRRMGLEDIL